MMMQPSSIMSPCVFVCHNARDILMVHDTNCIFVRRPDNIQTVINESVMQEKVDGEYCGTYKQNSTYDLP